MLVVVGRKASERCDDTGRAVTPLRSDQPVAIVSQALHRGPRQPVRQAFLLDGITDRGLRRPAVNLVVSAARQGEHAACEPVHGADDLVRPPVELLCPETSLRIPFVA